MGKRGLSDVSIQEWLKHVGRASEDIHSAIFPHMPVKGSAMCCCGMAKATATAQRELWLASEALSKASHAAEDGNHNAAAVKASMNVEKALRRIEPLAEMEKADILTEEGPKYPPDVESVQSNNRREIGDDGPLKPKVETPAGQSAFPLLPIAILAPRSLTQRGHRHRCSHRLHTVATHQKRRSRSQLVRETETTSALVSGFL
mmetsp:Transcript_87938/g.138818  ORF Transcript_87938/g.138818 Transcript_87938/m.138818 type:complete len:203 (+) Transcript_87938:64-672(+)